MATYNPIFNRAYEEIVKKLDICGVIPLVILSDKKNALPLAGALVGADITAVEITFRTSCAAEVIKTITSHIPALTVGAGTVTSVKEVQEAVAAGAKYIVTPAFNSDVVDRCIDMGIPVFPGCSTATDIDHAVSRGLRVVKFFPSELLGGIPMMKALSGPYPQVKYVPTGGINLDNLSEYLAFSKVLCCAGTFIASDENLEKGNFAEITRLARSAVAKVLDLQLDHVAIRSDNKTEIMKGVSRLAGVNFDPMQKTVFGVEATPKEENVVGTIVYSSPNLERCVYYLKNRGFCVDETRTVKENNRLVEINLLERFGSFSVQIVKK